MVVTRETKMFTVTMEDSSWSVSFVKHPNGDVSINLHWGDKITPTHIRDLDSGDSAKLLRFLNAENN